MPVDKLDTGLWFYRFNYKKREYRKQGFSSREEAEKAEAIKKGLVVQRTSSDAEFKNGLTLVEACEKRFVEFVQPHKKSWASDRAHGKAVKEYFKDRKIRDIEEHDIELFRSWVGRNRAGLGGKGKVKLHTVNHYHAFVKAVIRWATKKGLYVGHNAAMAVDLAKVPKARIRFLLPEEEKRLTPIVAKHTRLWPYYVVALYTGMRLGEISAIRVKDFQKYPNPMIFIPNSKSSRSRWVPLSGLALQVVEERAKGSPDMRLLEPVNKSTASLWFNEALAEAGIKEFSFHCLRHTFASHMLAKGTAIYIVSKMLGHSTVLVTEQHYGHLDRRTLSNEIYRIDGILNMPGAAKEPTDEFNVIRNVNSETITASETQL